MTNFCFRSCMIMAMCMFLFGIAAGNVWAADDVYKRGKDQTININCDNPTTRTDGTALAVDEIHSVEYYIDVAGGFTGTPLLTVEMLGGCMSTTIDLQQLPVKVELGRYAKTVDTGGLESVVAAGRTFIIETANPNAPGQIR